MLEIFCIFAIDMDEKERYINFDEYIRQGEPQQRKRSEAWKVAIGLQQVDRLQTLTIC